MSASSPQPKDNQSSQCGQDEVHERGGEQPQDHADMEADECAGDAHQGGGDIAAGGRAEPRQPAAGVAIEHEAGDDADHENNDEVEERSAADRHVSLALRLTALSHRVVVVGGMGAHTFPQHLSQCRRPAMLLEQIAKRLIR